MGEIETDYLVVGAGASGMAFVDSLIADSDADVVMVDRRDRPGGHWLDAYPFVRLHQPSAFYGVNSRTLGADRIDDSGPNAGFYERAAAVDITDYFDSVLQEHLGAGRVRFFGECDYQGRDKDGHHFVSLVTGETTTVKVRRKLVDATYIESSIPSRHTPKFDVDRGVRLVPPNDLVNLGDGASGYTVIGAGKTGMDTCNWLLDQGVEPNRIRWIRPRDGWVQDRAFMQPLELVGGWMELQAAWVQAAAEADSGRDFAHRMEATGTFVRLDPGVEPDVYRGATVNLAELASLRQIENVVRLGRVQRVATDTVTMEQGSIPSDAEQVYVDCTAAGVRPTVTRPIFEADRITIQYVTLGVVPWGAATLGAVEARREDDADKNRLCPPLTFTGQVSDMLDMSYIGISGLGLRAAEPDLAAWNEASRLNPGRGALDHLDDPKVLSALTSLGANIGPALRNLQRLTGV
jgi:hypothetical protein